MLKTPIEQDLEIGDYVPQMLVMSLNQEEHPVLLPDQPRVVIIASATCDLCKDYLTQWWPIIQEDDDFTRNCPILIFTDEEETVISDVGVSDYAFNGSRAFHRAFRAYTVPLTALFSPAGEVLALYRGTLTADQYKKLKESAINYSTNKTIHN